MSVLLPQNISQNALDSSHMVPVAEARGTVGHGVLGLGSQRATAHWVSRWMVSVDAELLSIASRSCMMGETRWNVMGPAMNAIFC